MGCSGGGSQLLRGGQGDSQGWDAQEVAVISSGEPKEMTKIGLTRRGTHRALIELLIEDGLSKR